MNGVTTISAANIFLLGSIAFTVVLFTVYFFYSKKSESRRLILLNELADVKDEVSSTFNEITTQLSDNVDQLIEEHHRQALKQATIQFWFSLISAVIGFIIIIIIIFIANSTLWYEYTLKLIPGLIIEAVSALFFSQSKHTRETSSDFLNRLREDRRYVKSISIVETITDEKLKSGVKAKIALRMSNVDTENEFLEKYLSE